MNRTVDTGKVGASGLQTAFVPALSSLIGRERELASAVALLHRDDVRLVTLTGPGGTGKTRLSIEIARTMRTAFTSGVHLVSMAEIYDLRLLAPTIARSLGLTESAGIDARDTLIAALRNKHLLVVLDNFEHLLDAAPLTTELLLACQGLKILVTSRAPLRVTGEHIFPIPPLDLPPKRKTLSVGQIAESAAVRLFVDRAQASVPSFSLSEQNASIVSVICHHLDGIPLAIELAATQCAVLPLETLLSRIKEGLALPIDGPRDAPDRHRTLNNAIAWSYALLSDREQQLVRIAGVFVGGFGLDAMEGTMKALEVNTRHLAPGPDPVTGGDASRPPTGAPDTLGSLALLVEHSLLRQQEWEGSTRFSMLETIRGFAQDQLIRAGEYDATRDAHADWHLALAEDNRVAWVLPAGEERIPRLEIELANIRATLQWLFERGDKDRLIRLVIALSGFWYEHSYYREGSEWLELTLAWASNAREDSRAQLMMELGLLLGYQGFTTRAQDLVAEGIELLRPAEHTLTLAVALIWQGAIANIRGDLNRAEEVLTKSLDLTRQISNRASAARITARALANLGVTAHERGDLVGALSKHEQALEICREYEYTPGAIRSLRDIGDVLRDKGDYAGSLGSYRECLSHLNKRGDRRVVIDTFKGAAMVAAAWDQPRQAAMLLGAADTMVSDAGSPAVVASEVAARQRAIATIRRSLGEEEFQAAWNAGSELTLEAAIAELQAVSPPVPYADDALDPSGMYLSEREKEVLELVADGHSDREIAEALFLSVRTVESHVSRIRIRFGVHTRSAAVSSAIAAGLIVPTLHHRE